MQSEVHMNSSNADPQPSSIRNRVREVRWVRGGNLRPNPKNWRRHPGAQADALAALLMEIGIAGALIARELPDGTLELIDGHLRAQQNPDTLFLVLVLDVSEAEADKLLLTMDPLAGMAERTSIGSGLCSKRSTLRAKRFRSCCAARQARVSARSSIRTR
jgi:hypothetical protein